jgi:hypothetical protein
MNLFNAQHQPKLTWPPTVVVARAYLDQLNRAKALPAALGNAVKNALDRWERARSTRDKVNATGELDRVAGQLSNAQIAEKDGPRARALYNVMKAIGTTSLR